MKLTQDEMHELEILTLLGEKDFDHNTCDNSYIDLVMNAGKKAFKIIKKQQKEIENQKNIIKEKAIVINNQELDKAKIHNNWQKELKENYVPKEVIRRKIKELENQKVSIKVGFEKIFETKMNNAKIIDTLRELLRGE